MRKLLFIHIPRATGLYTVRYFSSVLGYPIIISKKESPKGLWVDYTLEELEEFITERDCLLHSHTLAHGWSPLADSIPFASQARVNSMIERFKKERWFVFTFVRHPGELLCSFYYYIHDFNLRGEQVIVDAHYPLIDMSIDDFVAENCDKSLLPDNWREFDFVAEASPENFKHFYGKYFGHCYKEENHRANASSNLGYFKYCNDGLISKSTQEKVAQSTSMKIYKEIVDNSNFAD